MLSFSPTTRIFFFLFFYLSGLNGSKCEIHQLNLLAVHLIYIIRISIHFKRWFIRNKISSMVLFWQHSMYAQCVSYTHTHTRTPLLCYNSIRTMKISFRYSIGMLTRTLILSHVSFGFFFSFSSCFFFASLFYFYFSSSRHIAGKHIRWNNQWKKNERNQFSDVNIIGWDREQVENFAIRNKPNE